MTRILNILSNHIDFHELVLLEKKTDKLYRWIRNSFTDNLAYQKKLPQENPNYGGQRPMVLTSVPSYIDTELDLGTDIIIKKVRTFPGSLIKLSAYKSYEEYLKKTFDQKGRSHFAKCQNLLNECFTIRHQIYYGSMEKEEYQIVFNAFEQMQARRFKQKGLQSGTDPMLSEYREKTLELVRNKQACISVIYNGDTPIAISLNYILGKIIHGFTKTFDSAYSKFSLGHIELLNVIKWSFDEGFEVFDFMKGEYSYKNRFADTSYPFLLETIYHKKGTLNRIWGRSVFLGLKLFYFIYHATRLVRSANTKRSRNISRNLLKVQKIPVDTDTISVEEKRVHFDEIQSQYIQKAICDYCYRNREPMDSFKFYLKDDHIKMISMKEVLIFKELQPNMKNVSFLAELLEKDTITEHVRSISLKDDPNKVYLNTTDKLEPRRENVLYTDVPGYLNVTFTQNGQKKWGKSVATFEGSYIDLKKYTDLDQLLKSKLSSKRVSRLRAYKRTLEKVFPINYQYYYGEIQDRTYENLMNTLKQMVTSRFDEKQMSHMALTEWDRFKELGKGLIREKKASLIVIYHGDEPIHISFNYIWKQLVFGYVRGFNIDYSKFYLGYIDIMIQLQWCFEMGFEIYDLLRENMEYKLRFADHTYLYACHITVAKQGPLSIISPLITWLSLSLKFDIYYPFMSRLRAIYHRIPFLPKRKKRRIQPFYHLEKLDKEQLAKMDKKRFSQTGIDSLNEPYGKRAIYHFLYLSKDKLEHLKIYTSLDDEHSIILECPNSLGKVIFKNRVEKHGK